MKTTVSKWEQEPNELYRRRLGKLIEECGELTAIAARCLIQGVDGINPDDQHINRIRLENELADVHAQIACTVNTLGLDFDRILDRAIIKRSMMDKWETLLKS